MPRNQLAQDVFTRSDSSDLGADWDAYTGLDSGAIASNHVQSNANVNHGGQETYNATTPPNNQWASVQFITLSGGSGYVNGGVLCRAAAPNTQTSYLCALQFNDIFIGKQVASVFTSLANVTKNPTAPETISLECVGTGLEGFIDGVSLLSTTDSDIASGRTGITWYTDTGVSVTNIVFDNFTMGDFTAGTALVHRGLLLGVGI